MKGDFNDECNGKLCGNKPAIYYNHATQKYYCADCANFYNEFNGEIALKYFGHVLCTVGEHKETAA